MTANAPLLTDDILQQALTELAAGPDGDLLLTDVLRSVDSRTQAGRRPWDVRGWGRVAALLAAAALLTALTIGTAVTLSRPLPKPVPSPSATEVSRPVVSPRPVSANAITVSDFAVPFTYHLPVGNNVELSPAGQEGVVYFADEALGPGTLELFPLSDYVHDCGTSVGNGLPTSLINTQPFSFLEELRDNAGVGVRAISETTLGNVPAVGADIDPTVSTCSKATIHIDHLGMGFGGLEPDLSRPGRLIVARIGTRSLGVFISAPTEHMLAAWMSIAQAYVNSFEFEGGQ